jgi:hypothetical protein
VKQITTREREREKERDIDREYSPTKRERSSSTSYNTPKEISRERFNATPSNPTTPITAPDVISEKYVLLCYGY